MRWLGPRRSRSGEIPGPDAGANAVVAEVERPQDRDPSPQPAAPPMTLVARALAAAASPSRRLTVVDVGCRWGAGDRWTELGDRVRIVGFDPDADECARLQSGVDPADTLFVPTALAAAPGRRVLHLTREPACSSLYPPDTDLVAEVPILDCISPVGTTTVEVTTLDAWIAETGTAPDVLKLDVQGAELDVLQGATVALSTVRALEVEVEFNPIYLGQPLFGDVDALLRSRGFVLWRLDHLVHYRRGEAMREAAMASVQVFEETWVSFARPGGQLYWGHATYVRDDVVAAGGDRGRLAEDALIAAALGLDDLALMLLGRAGG